MPTSKRRFKADNGRWAIVSASVICVIVLMVSGCGKAGTNGGGGAEESPWPCSHGGPNLSGYSPVDTTKVSGAVEWEYFVPGTYGDNPVIGGDGTIYAVSKGAINYTNYITWEYTTFPGLYAISRDGELKWCFRYDNLDIELWKYGGAPLNPAIDPQGVIYVSPDTKNLFAIDNSGALKWNITLDSPISACSPIIGPTSQLYYRSYESIVCLYPNGTERWKHPFDEGGLAHSYTMTAVGEDGSVAAVVGDNLLVKLSPSGELLWSYRIKNESYGFPLATRVAPAISQGGIVYAGSVDSRLYAFNSTGNLLWINQLDGPISETPAIGGDGTVCVVTGEDTLNAISAKGAILWDYTAPDSLLTAPIIDAKGNVYVSSGEGNLIALDAEGGQRWTLNITEINGMISNTTVMSTYWSAWPSSPAVGADGRLYLYTGIAVICIGWEEGRDTLPMVAALVVAIAVPVAACVWWLSKRKR